MIDVTKRASCVNSQEELDAIHASMTRVLTVHAEFARSAGDVFAAANDKKLLANDKRSRAMKRVWEWKKFRDIQKMPDTPERIEAVRALFTKKADELRAQEAQRMEEHLRLERYGMRMRPFKRNPALVEMESHGF